MYFSVGQGVMNFFTKKNGIVVATSEKIPSNVIVRFGDVEELVPTAELQPSDHLQNPSTTELVERFNPIVEDPAINQSTASKLGIEGDLLSAAFVPQSNEIEVLYSNNSKFAVKKVSINKFKEVLVELEDQIS